MDRRHVRRTALPQMTDRLAIGQQGLTTSPFCLGWVSDSDTIPAAFDAGINFFFLTADMHWPLYEASRRGLDALLRRGTRVRDQIVVAVTSYVTQPEFTHGPFLEVLGAIPRLQRIDMIVIGGAHGGEFPSRQEVYREYLRRGEFGARALGTTFHDRAAAVTAFNQSQVDLAFIRYNPLHPTARDDLFPKLGPSATRLFSFKSTVGYARPRDLRAMGVSPDQWLPRPTDYYRFALSHPAVDGILCAPRRRREVTALERALRAPPLESLEQRYLIALAKLSSRKVGAIGLPTTLPRRRRGLASR
jgi:hypothetical protein